MDISLRHIKHVVALARYRNFGEAAEALGISQPALSRSIQTLEEGLGVKLFDRELRGGIEPTIFAQVILDRGQALLLDSEELVREIELLQGMEVGQLSVSSGLYPAELSVSQAVGRLVRQHPGLRCRLRITDWRQATTDVLERKVDVAIAEISEAEQHPQLKVALAGNHPLAFFCRRRHPILRRKRITLEDVAAYPWISTRAPKRIVTFLPKSLHRAGWIDPESGDFVSSVVVDDLMMARQIIRESDGIGAAPPALLAHDLARNELVCLPLKLPWLQLRYGFIYLQPRSLSPAAQALMQEVLAIEEELGQASG
jgi:DNA-binding transcriptional LysR family regulator